jgi:hypothetical protein
MAKALNEIEKKQLNLASLQKEDRNITDILGKASHVVIYKFDNQKTQWIRIDVEGSAFIVAASIAPFLRLLVLNRLSQPLSILRIPSPSHIICPLPPFPPRCQYLHIRSCSSDESEVTISLSHAQIIWWGLYCLLPSSSSHQSPD